MAANSRISYSAQMSLKIHFASLDLSISLIEVDNTYL